MFERYRQSVTRIYTPDGKVAGAGFMLGPEYLLTCAHVVANALNCQATQSEKPKGEIRFDLPDIPSYEQLSAYVEVWQPLRIYATTRGARGDIALLRVVKPIIEEEYPVLLVHREDLWNHECRIWGFPKDKPQGVWSPGILRAADGSGWVLLEDIGKSAYFVSQGFSGAPVWDDMLGGIVGMMAAIEGDKERRAAYLIPVSIIRAIWPSLVVRPHPFMAGGPPQDFVKRAELNDLKNLLLTNEQSATNLLTVGLTGAGGFGKTTLARGLCNDYDIWRRFPDGILWVTVGKDSLNVTPQLNDLLRSLDERLPEFATETAAAAKLHAMLRERHVLLVIDDIWFRSQLDPFLGSTPRGACLVTSRLHNLLPQSAPIIVDAMKAEEAVKLLGNNLPGVSRAYLLELSKRLGEWPLLLNIINRVMQDLLNKGQTIDQVSTYINKRLEKKGLTAFDPHNEKRREYAVALTLEVGMDQLDSSERERYLELAIFPEDVNIPLKTVFLLWKETADFDEWDTTDLCIRLQNLSLLLRLDLTLETIRLHDVVRDYLVHQKHNISQLHDTLLSAYRAYCNNSWASGPNDGYFLQNLTYHLMFAGRQHELNMLLVDLIWLSRRLLDTGITGLLSDYRFAGDDPAQQVGRTLRRAAHILSKDPFQLPTQLYGRISDSATRDLLNETVAIFSHTWLRPVSPSLRDPAALIQTLEAHLGPVTSIAMTDDAKIAVSVSSDKTLKVWDLERGELKHSILAHADKINALVLDQSNTLAITASADKTIKIWDFYEGIELRAIVTPTGINALGISADGQLVISGADNAKIEVFSLATNQKVASLGVLEGVTHVALNPQGTFAAAASRSQWRGWSVSSGKMLALILPKYNVKGTLLPKDGNIILLSESIELRNPNIQENPEEGLDKSLIRRFQESAERATSIALSQDESRAVTGSLDGRLKVWNMKAEKAVQTLMAHLEKINSVAINRDGTKAISASDDGTLKVWNLVAAGKQESSMEHSGEVTSVALSGDGTLAISGSRDGTLKLWNPTTANQLQKFMGHVGGVIGVAVDFHGKLAVTSSWDSTMKVWDLEAEQAMQKLYKASKAEGEPQQQMRHFVTEAAIGGIAGVAVDWKGVLAVSPSWDGSLNVWSLQDGQLIRTLRGHQGRINTLGRINSIAINRNGNLAISASDTGTVKVWDLGSGDTLWTLRGHCVALSDNGKLAVSGFKDGTLTVWDLTTGAPLQRLPGHAGEVTSVDISNNGKLVVSVSYHGTLNLWDLDSGQAVYHSLSHGGRITSVALSADSKIAVSASVDRTLRVWNLSTGEVTRLIGEHSSSIMAMAITEDGKRAISGSYDGLLQAWDLTTGSVTRIFGNAGFAIMGVALSGNGELAVAVTEHGIVQVWNLESAQLMWKFPAGVNNDTGVVLSADGKLALSIADDGGVRIWSVDAGQAMQRLTGHIGRILGIALSKDGKVAVTASHDRTIKVWDVNNRTIQATLVGHRGPVIGVAITVDGKKAISISADGTLKVWDLVEGEEIHSLELYTDRTTNVIVSSNGDFVVCTTEEGKVRIWNLQTGKLVRTLEGHTGLVADIQLSANDRLAVSASHDGTLQLWDVAEGSCLAIFNANGPLHSCAITADGSMIITGGQTGTIHFLTVENLKVNIP